MVTQCGRRCCGVLLPPAGLARGQWPPLWKTAFALYFFGLLCGTSLIGRCEWPGYIITHSVQQPCGCTCHKAWLSVRILTFEHLQ